MKPMLLPISGHLRAPRFAASAAVAFGLLAAAILPFAGHAAKNDGPGSPAQPLRYIGPPLPDPMRADGGLRPAVGVQSFQVFRSSRLHPELTDGRGWTFNHAPVLAYWKGRFYLEFINSPIDEHGWPTHAVMTSSADGRHWSEPRIVFPHRESADFRSLIHQRMGFFVAPNGRLLVMSHYGVWNPKTPLGGPGHVVREVHEDGTLGPIYFIHYGEGWNQERSFYPFYDQSHDAGFLEACKTLLGNSLMKDQWFEADLGYPAGYFMPVPGPYRPEKERKALSFFHRKDGVAVGLWKKAWSALSYDGRSWTQPVQAPGVARTFAKIWGQRTSDGRFALAYDPQDHPPGNRWPLAVVTSDDGITFDGMLCVHCEFPNRRYPGKAKDIGPQYFRGIAEGNPTPADGSMWLTYSVDKEDIWVSRVPVPIRSRVDSPVHDSFDEMDIAGVVRDWNVYSPRWAPVGVAAFPSDENRSLRLQDADPYDYARASRVFPESKTVTVGFKLFAGQNDHGRLEVEVMNAAGRRPVRVFFAPTGRIEVGHAARVVDVGGYEPHQWMSCRLAIDTARGNFSLWIDGRQLAADVPFAESASSVERLSFRTGAFRVPNQDQMNPQNEDGPPDGKNYYAHPVDPATDHPIDPATFYVDDVVASAR